MQGSAVTLGFTCVLEQHTCGVRARQGQQSHSHLEVQLRHTTPSTCVSPRALQRRRRASHGAVPMARISLRVTVARSQGLDVKRLQALQQLPVT